MRGSEALSGCLAAVAILLAHWLIGSGVLMLFVGVVHAEYWDVIPTMSFRAALIIYGVFAVLYTVISGVSNNQAA